VKLKVRVGAFALAFPFFASASTSFAAGNLVNIKICNNFPETIHFAIAYGQSDGDWVSRGWMNVQTGKCYYFDTTLSVPDFYYRAQTDPYRENGRLHQETWGTKNSVKSFCVNPSTKNTFNFWQANTKNECAKNGYVSFVEYLTDFSIRSNVDNSYQLTFNADGTTDASLTPVK